MFHEGQQIGLYTLIRKLGRGGFGEVWLAERKSKFVTTKVAVKLPLDEQVNFDAIHQEATLWEQASGHANVLPIIDADIYDGQVVIVSEYADGGSLADKLKKEGKFSIQKAIEITIGILSGLEYLHNKQIIHRDIKPQNILLQGDTPRLADFGISRAMQTSSISSTIVGTDAYMSPESFQGERNIQSDIWSVGIVLYQLLKGFLPFPQENPSERMYAILQKDFEPLPVNIPRDVKNVITKALAKLPENRYQSAGEMREYLRQIKINKAPKAFIQKETVVIPSNLSKSQISSNASPETKTVVRKKSVSKAEQAQGSPTEPETYKTLADATNFDGKIIDGESQPKHTPLKSFAKLFLMGFVLLGVVILGVALFDKYVGFNNLRSENNVEPTRNPVPSATKAPNKEITPIPRKKTTPSNVNTYSNTNTIQEPAQNQDDGESNNQQEQATKERTTIAFQNLQNEMLQTAEQISRKKHQSSNLVGCSSLKSDFRAISQTVFERSFKCRMKGSILGIRSFEVGITVRGKIISQGSNFTTQIIDSNVDYDKEF